MNINDLEWSKAEKKIARQAFDKAYETECAQMMKEILKKAENLRKPEDIWRLHDYLSKKRRKIDKTYDYRYSRLIFVFAGLINEGVIDLSNLDGLGDDKINMIKTVLSLSE